ncbi:hypothetical protein [Nocardia sp. NPDC004722]
MSIALEPGDGALGSSAVKIIRRLVLHGGAARVVLDGYLRPPVPDERAQRTDLLGDLADGLDVLAEIAGGLLDSGEQTHLMPFGWLVRAAADLVDGHSDRTVHLRASGGRGGDVIASLDTLEVGAKRMPRFRRHWLSA